MSRIESHAVASIPVPTGINRESARKILLAVGAASTVLYIAMDTIAALSYEGYNYASQTISELSAIGAPTRGLWLPLGVAYNLMLLAGVIGLWQTHGGRAIRAIAVLEAGMVVLGFAGWPFAPMHQREVLAAGGSSLSDTLHLVYAGISSVIFFLCIALGSRLFGTRFFIYSVATIALMLVFGFYTGRETPRVGDNLSTPLLGIAERITVFGSMIWLSAFNLRLMVARNAGTESARP